MATSPPVSREQAFLESYFIAVSQFAFDKAKELIDKERDAIKSQLGGMTLWHSMLICLSQLALNEKNYSSFMFLMPKGFLRKDSSLKSSYEALKHDFKRLESEGSRINSAEECLERLLAHLCGHLAQFANARIEVMDFYEKLYMSGINKGVNYEELLGNISGIIQSNHKFFHHPIISCLKTSFNLECECLFHLIQAQLKLLQWNFLTSLVHLHETNTRLNSWGSILHSKENKKLSFTVGFHRHVQVPPLYSWMGKFKAALVGKFSLYFYEILSRQSTSQEMKTLVSKESGDLCQRLISFQKKSDAVSICLVLDTHDCISYKGHGYHQPDKPIGPPQGLDSYPAIVCIPNDRPQTHWPNVIMLMGGRMADLNQDRIVFLYDKNVQSTYYLARLEPLITLIAIFESKKSEKDSYIINFIIDFVVRVRGQKLFATLKPGSR